MTTGDSQSNVDEAAQAAPQQQEAAFDPRHFPIVGVGASAGGLEAYSQLLKALPADTGMAFVLIQHLAPSHESMLAEILARSTSMPVVEVKDEPAVIPNHVYVIPPDRDMFINGGHLRLAPREDLGRQHRTIDGFFRSLAEDLSHRAIGIVLSGTGNDGTLGLEEIKAEGGITFAQDETAQFDGMPHSAIAAGCVDYVLPPAKIAAELSRIARHPHVKPLEMLTDAETDLRKILRQLRDSTSVDFANYKATTLYRRISRRVLLHNLSGLNDYVELLRDRPDEVHQLYRDILINVTSFFRDSEMFQALKAKVFPRLLAKRPRHEQVRVWVLGCSTGEEAYSIAMALREFIAESKSEHAVQVFATDLNEQAIEKARAGIYSQSIAQDISVERLRRFFSPVEGGYQIAKSVREMCVFAKHNILADPPFSRMDLISCRNVLIYMEPAAQRKLVPLFHYALRNHGALVLGGSETVGTFSDLFEIIDPKQKIYLRRPVPNPHDVPVPLARGATFGPLPTAPPRRPTAETNPILEIQREADRLALSKYSPAGVLLNPEFEVVQFRGDTGRFLSPPPGRPSLNVLKMAREGLLVGLRAALQKAQQENTAVRAERIAVRTNGGFQDIDLEVVPVRGSSSERFFLVLFEDPNQPLPSSLRGAAPPSAEPVALSAVELADPQQQVNRLTQELAATRDYMQSLLEQQQAANEELQSANEEIQSSNEELQSINEELQTSKEEVQSSNEELTTVNEELRTRNEQLNLANSDLSNFLASTQLAVVMVGSDLRIRRFTPQAEKLLNLIATDVGRPIGDIKFPLRPADLDRLIKTVIDEIVPQEVEVQDREGRWHSLRVRPYRTLDNRIDGAVIVLVDIDSHKRAVAQLRETDRRKDEFLAMLAHELRNPLAPLKTSVEVLKIAPADSAALESSRQVMERQLQILTRLVDDLLDASRISQGKITLQSKPLDLRAIVQEAISGAEHLIDARRHKLSIVLPQDSVAVEGDAVRLEQVVHNLLGNAAKFTDPGGRIELKLQCDGRDAVLHVKDSGIGIAPEMLPHVFDLFVQADNSYARERGGLGIGLSLVKQLVVMHGGSVHAHSAGLERGSEFTVRLPLTPAGADTIVAPVQEEPPGAPAQIQPLRILVLDDNVDGAESFGRLLRAHGHNVRVVYRGADALEIASEFRPQVAFLDVAMPVMDGFEVARRFRQRHDLGQLILIALSGYGQDSDRQRTQQAGFDEHLVKPADIDELERILQRAAAAAKS